MQIGAEMAEHDFRVVPAYSRFSHAGHAIGVEAGKQYGRFDLCRGHSGLIMDAVQRTSCNVQGGTIIAVYAGDISAHQG